ncbi:hypothetical protein GEMRC1_004058 [Eukaryota sp. GEM-RC1]
MIVFSIAWWYICLLRIKKVANQMSLFTNELVERGYLDEQHQLTDTFVDSTTSFENCPKISNPYDLDVLTRCLQPRPLKSKHLNSLKILFSLYEHVFVDSILFICFKLSFEVHLLKDSNGATATMNNLKNLDLDLHLDERLLLVRFSHQLEILRRQQSTGQNVDSSSFLHFQRQQKELAILHNDCIEGLYAFWSTLGSAKVDLSKLPSILERVQKSKKTINLSFSKLLHQYGDQQSLLQSYANYVRDVECDEERASSIENQAQMLTSSDKSSSHAPSSYGGSLALTSKTAGRKKRSRGSMFSFSETDHRAKKSAISVLRSSVSSALIVMLLIASASFFVSSSVLSSVSHRVDQIYELTHVEQGSQWMALTSTLPMLFKDSLDTEDLALDLLRNCEHLTFHMRRLTLTEPIDNYDESPCERTGNRKIKPPNEELQTLMRALRFPVIFMLEFIPRTEDARVLSAWTLGLRHALETSLYAKKLLTGQNIVLTDLQLVYSSLQGISDATHHVYRFLIEASDDFFQLSFIIQIISNFVILSIIVVIGLLLFARSFAKIIDERNSILNLFLYIPKDEIFKILNHKKFDRMRKRLNHVFNHVIALTSTISPQIRKLINRHQ